MKQNKSLIDEPAFARSEMPHPGIAGTRVDPPELPQEASPLGLLVPLVERRRLIATVSLLTLLSALIISLVLPNRYTAEARILPPQQSQSSLTSMLGSQMGPLSALAGIAGKDLGIKNPADLYVGILRGRSICDAVIEKFKLKRYYNDKNLVDARIDLEKDVQFDAGKDGIISITVQNKNPKVASDMANEFVDQLHNANHRLALSEASQRRIFFEEQVKDEKNQLAESELAMKGVQESTGLIEVHSQAEAIIRSVASLQAIIASKEVEIQSAKLFATDQNPDLIRIQNELAALKAQLAKAEHTEKMGNGNIELATGKIPEAGLQYLRRYRDLKYHEALFEVLAKQYEAARIDEGRSAAVVQVVDYAVEPDKRSGPPRSLICLIGFLGGFVGVCIYIFARDLIVRLQRDPKTGYIVEAIYSSIRRKKERA